MSIRSRAGNAAAWFCTLYAVTTFAWYGVWRHFYAERSADEAIFENLLWNGVHGDGLRTWVEGGIPHLAVHFSPALYLLLPFYAWFGSLHFVHFVASVSIAVAGYLFHGHVARTLEPRAALPAMVAFLLCPTIVLQTFMEFHEQALAILPLTLLLIAWSESRRARTLWSALALLSVREDNALLVLALGVLGLLDARRRVTGGMLLVLGLAWLSLWRVVAIQLLAGGTLPTQFAETYGLWGSSPSEMLRAIFTRPLDVVRHVLSPVPLRYLALLLLPVLAVLPLGSPLTLVMLPQLFLVLLADHETRLFQIRMHYSIVPLVVMLFAAVATLARLDPARSGFASFTRRWVPMAMMAIALFLAPGWAMRAAQRLNPYSVQIREVLAHVPDTASVTAPGYLLNHLAARSRIALAWSENVADVEVVVVEDSSRFFLRSPTVDVFHSPRLDSILVARGYVRGFSRYGWHVYQRAPLRAAAPPG